MRFVLAALLISTLSAAVTAQLFPGDIVYVRERWF